MPDWLIWIAKLFPENSLDKGVAIWLVVMAVAFGFSGAGAAFYLILRAARFFGPQIRAISEGHVKTMNIMSENQVRQTELVSRVVNMTNTVVETQRDHGEILNDHSEKLDTHSKILGELRDRVVVKQCELKKS